MLDSSLVPGSLWVDRAIGTIVRVLHEPSGDKVMYESTHDPKQRVRTTWIDRFLTRFEPARRPRLADVVKLMRASERAGKPHILSPGEVRLVLRSVRLRDAKGQIRKIIAILQEAGFPYSCAITSERPNESMLRVAAIGVPSSEHVELIGRLNRTIRAGAERHGLDAVFYGTTLIEPPHDAEWFRANDAVSLTPEEDPHEAPAECTTVPARAADGADPNDAAARP